MDEPASENLSATNVSGGVNLTSDQTDIGGDVIGRDKVTHIQGDQINYTVQLDVQKLVETLKQALPDNDPLPADVLLMLNDFRTFHTRLWEWKELHNALNDVIYVLDQYSREIERRDAVGQLGDLRALQRLWKPVNQKVTLLQEFAARVQHIGSVLVILPDGSMQGPAWAVELSATATRINELFSERVADIATLYDATYAFCDAAEKHMYLADKQLRETAGELYTLSNMLLGSLNNDPLR